MASRPGPKGRVLRSCDGRMLPAPGSDGQQMKYAGKKIKSDNDAEKNRDGSGSSTSSREKRRKSSKRRKTQRKGGRGSETQTGETGMEEEESSKRSFFTCNCVLCTAAALFLTLSLFVAVVVALHFTGVIDLSPLYLSITGKK
nr:unnamed protein product [Haemonchus contortus]